MISIDKNVFGKFHKEFMVGVLLCSKIDNNGSSADIHEMLRDMEEFIRINFSPDSAKTHQVISSWRTAIAQFGDKFEHNHSNVEKLMLRVLDGEDIPSSDRLTDLCNFFSLKHITPIGAFDMKKVVGNLKFTIAKGSEKFKGGVEKGELILSDGKTVRSRKLNYESDSKVMVSSSTKKALVVIEVIPPIGYTKLERMVDELAGLIRVFCGGKVEKAILTQDKVEF